MTLSSETVTSAGPPAAVQTVGPTECRNSVAGTPPCGAVPLALTAMQDVLWQSVELVCLVLKFDVEGVFALAGPSRVDWVQASHVWVQICLRREVRWCSFKTLGRGMVEDSSAR